MDKNEKMTEEQYLDMLNWDKSLWTIVNAEEALPFLAIGGYQNYVYSISPKGEKSFGKGSKVIKIDWMEKHKPEAIIQTEEPTASIPPPPAKAAEVPPVPAPVEAKPEVPAVPDPVEAKAEVPEKEPEPASLGLRVAQLTSLKWKENGDALDSPNGKSITREELGKLSDSEFFELMKIPAATKEEAKKEWPGFVITRVENLISKGFKADVNGNPTVISPDGKYYGYKEIEDMENAEWTSLLKGDGVPAEIKEVAKASDNIEIVTIPKEEEPEKPKGGDGAKRIEFLVKNGLESHEIDDTPAVLTPDGKIFTIGELAEMENEAWMQMTTTYSGFNVKKMKEANDLKQKAIDQAQERDDSAIDKYESEKKSSESSDEDLKNKVEKLRQDNILDRKKAEEEAAKKAIEDGPRSAVKEEKEKGKTTEEVVKDIKSDPEKGPDESEMTTGDAGGFFGILAELGFGQLNLSVNKLDEGRLGVIAKLNDFNGIQSIELKEISGTPEEVQKDLLKMLNKLK